MFAKKITNKQEREKNMEEMTKKTLGEMIGEMLQTEDLNTTKIIFYHIFLSFLV